MCKNCENKESFTSLSEEENKKVYGESAQELMTGVLTLLGQDVTREGLQDTPKRYIKFMQQFLHHEPFNMTTFSAEQADEMIIVQNIPFFSLCEHHLAPFFGTAAIAYIPDQKIVGLSKLPRTLDLFARRLQNQERITTQVADYIQEHLKPKGVAVSITARHLCVEMRGIQKHDVSTTTNKLLGVFKEEQETRQEFFNSINRK